VAADDGRQIRARQPISFDPIRAHHAGRFARPRG
jgi:hypothetical protein